MLEDLLGALELPGDSPLTPMAAGGLGFLAYDLKNHLERLPTTAVDDLHLPEMVFAFPRRLVVHDRRGGRFWQVGVTYEDAAGAGQRPGGLASCGPRPLPWALTGSGPPRATLPGRPICTALTRIREYIRPGDVYQVNLTQRFSFPLSGEPYHLFQRLFQPEPGALLRLSALRRFSGALHLHGALPVPPGRLSGDPAHQGDPAPGGHPGGGRGPAARNWPRAPRTTPSSP